MTRPELPDLSEYQQKNANGTPMVDWHGKPILVPHIPQTKALSEIASLKTERAIKANYDYYTIARPINWAYECIHIDSLNADIEKENEEIVEFNESLADNVQPKELKEYKAFPLLETILPFDVWYTNSDTRRKLLKDKRDLALESISHSFSDGRILQVRPADLANIQLAISIGVDREWVTLDNKVAEFTIEELQLALESGIAQGQAIWDQYMTDIKATNEE